MSGFDLIRPPTEPNTEGSRFASLPVTRSGWWAGSLGIAFAVLLALVVALSKVHVEALIFVGRALFGVAAITGTAAAFLALVALVARGERSWWVWLGMVPGVLILAVFFLEFTLME